MTPPSEAPTFGELLRRHRRTAGLTQEELAERAGLSRRGINDLERGERIAPRKDTVALLADALGLVGDERAAFVASARRGPLKPAASSVPSLSVDRDGDPAAAEVAHSASNAEHPEPAAIHTFLIADVRGYTHFTLEQGDEAAARLATRFAELARMVVVAQGGRVLELRGDEALASFTSARRALSAAVELQDQFAAASAEDPLLPLRVGMGLDAGEALPVEGGYRGTALNLAARLCALAGPGEVLASETVMTLARRVAGLVYEEHGAATLKGFAEPVRVLRVVASARVAEEAEEAVSGRGETVGASGTSPESPPASHVDQPLPMGGFLGARPEGPLVARDAEMARLNQVLDTVVAGTGRLVLLAGEPGVGKTRLAQELMLAARERGVLVATGRCYEPQAAVAYYPFVEALHYALAQAPTDVRSVLRARWPDVVRLLPDGRSIADPPGTVPLVDARGVGDDRLRLFWQVTACLQALAKDRPFALLLDDLHWADGASLDLLAHLVRHTRADRLLLLGIYRDVEVGRQHPLGEALRDLTHERLAERIAVRRLPEEGTRGLISAALGEAEVSAEFVRLLHERAEGNAFFTREVLQDLIERGEVYRGESGARWERRPIEEMAVPEGVRAVIGQRVARLTSGAQEALAQAAVLGQVFTFEDLAGMSGHAEEELERALEEATAVGLVRESAGHLGRDAYTFQHALIQQTLMAELTARRRRRLHRAAGEALERLPERAGLAAELAWHFAEADEPAHALPHALAAGDQAEAVYAHAEAERHYRMAADLAAELDDRPHEAEAREQLADALDNLARYVDKRQALERAEALYRGLDDGEGQRRVGASLGLLETPADGIAWLHPLLEAVESTPPSRGTVRVLRAADRLHTRAGQHVRALEFARRAVEHARSVDDEGLVQQMVAAQANALFRFLRRGEEAVHLAEGVAVWAEQIGRLETLNTALNLIAHRSILSGEFDAAHGAIERCIAAARRMDMPDISAFFMMHRGYILYWAGDWAQAERDYEQALEAATRIGTSFTLPPLLNVRGLLRLSQGQLSEATQLLERALSLAPIWTESEVLRKAGGPLAEYAILRGDPESARKRLEPLVQPRGFEEMDSVFYVPQLAWAYVELGELERAAATLEGFIEAAREGGARLGLAEALRVRGMLEMRRGQLEEAAATLEEALDLCCAMPYPYGKARVLYTYGQLDVQRGEPEQAHERYEAALVVCGRLGERLYAEQIEQERARLTDADPPPERKDVP